MADDKLTAACRGCCYAGREYCNYEVHTGHFRPCPPGVLCHFRPTRREPTEYELRNEERIYGVSAKRDYRTLVQRDELFSPLYKKGFSDREIAKRTNVSPSTVGTWRRLRHLPLNYPAAGKEKIKNV